MRTADNAYQDSLTGTAASIRERAESMFRQANFFEALARNVPSYDDASLGTNRVAYQASPCLDTAVKRSGFWENPPAPPVVSELQQRHGSRHQHGRHEANSSRRPQPSRNRQRSRSQQNRSSPKRSRQDYSSSCTSCHPFSSMSRRTMGHSRSPRRGDASTPRLGTRDSRRDRKALPAKRSSDHHRTLRPTLA